MIRFWLGCKLSRGGAVCQFLPLQPALQVGLRVNIDCGGRMLARFAILFIVALQFDHVEGFSLGGFGRITTSSSLDLRLTQKALSSLRMDNEAELQRKIKELESQLERKRFSLFRNRLLRNHMPIQII